MALIINLDLSALQEMAKEIAPENVQRAALEAVRDLSAATFTHIQEIAQSELHSTREKYLAALSLSPETVDGVWVINLDAKMRFREDGKAAGSMVEDLLKSKKTKTSKSGVRYLSVPFNHSTRPDQQTPPARDLTNAIKKHMKNEKIPFQKLEKDSQGKVITGKLHSFNVTTPNKTHEGPGMGRGAIGQPRVGHTGVPFLHGVNIYQIKTGNGTHKKAIMTFRMVTSKDIGTERWFSPGVQPLHAFERGYEWAQDQLDKVILPRLIEYLSKK